MAPINKFFLLLKAFLALFVFMSFYAVVPVCRAEENDLRSSGGGVISEDEQILDPEVRRERKIGRKTVDAIEKNWELIADPARLVHLSMIVDTLKPHLKREIPYEVRIVRMDTPNAFCLPGGFIFFTSKMLELLHSDAEIAAVMAHEMIHVDQNHGIKMAAKTNQLTLAALAVILASGGAMAPAVLAQVAQVAVNSAYSIEFEKEADSMGLDVLIAAGYPPSAMVTLMEGFMHEEMKQPIREYGIYMDHPDSIERVHSMGEKLKKLRIALERKHPLHLLRTSIREEGEKARLFVDDVRVWEGAKNDLTIELLQRVREFLDRDFQMEMAPYDLQLEGEETGNGVLRLKNNILAQTPLPEGMQSLSALRENLLRALARAQRKHPIAKYFKY
ncbi:MAG: M48 family metallopeptidase [Synergistaceae bacterium]|nr:M48 family metallopeptidase [Synergistaceae bacterium]